MACRLYCRALLSTELSTRGLRSSGRPGPPQAAGTGCVWASEPPPLWRPGPPRRSPSPKSRSLRDWVNSPSSISRKCLSASKCARGSAPRRSSRHGLVHQEAAGGREPGVTDRPRGGAGRGRGSRAGPGDGRGSGGAHWAADGAVTECFMSTGSGPATRSAARALRLSDGTRASGEGGEGSGKPVVQERATGAPLRGR